VTPDARVLQFPTSATARPQDYGRFSRELSADELAGCFCFSDDDQRQIARRRRDVNRLGFAVQLGTVRYLGRFLENPAGAPEQVVAWTAREIGVAASTGLAGYGEGEWRWAHQAEIRRTYGYQPFSAPGVEPDLVEWLRARAWVTAESSRTLFARASELLMGRRILLPGWSTLWRLVGAARESADERGWMMLAATLNGEQRERLERLLHVTAGQRVTELERLRMAPVEPTIKGLIAALERLRELRVLADGLAGLEALPHARVRVLMVAAERQRGGELADLRESRRLATLMAFAITAAQRGQDDALEHFDRLHGDLLLRAAAAGKRERLRDGEAIDDAGRTLARACSVLLDDTIAEPLRDAVFAAVERERLAAAVTAIGRLTRSPDDRARELVTRSYTGVRRYLPLLLDTIEFHATDGGEPILEALTALKLSEGRRKLTPEVLPTRFVPRPWQGLVEPESGRVDRAAYTMCVLEELRDGLRRRDVYVTPSERFADARSSLLCDAAWDASREDTCRALSLPIEPDAFIEQLAGDLDDAYQRTRDGLTPQHAIHDLAARGELPVERLDALPEPASLTALRARVDSLMPPADLPDLALEIAAKTGFLEAFTNDHEPNAQLHDLEISLCAVLVAQACNVGYRPLVDESNPALRESRLRYVAQRYMRADTLAAANARIVDYHAKLPLAERWGGGEVASIDGLRFVVPRRTIHAGYNRRYFDRRRGVTALGTTADHYAGLRTIVIPGTQPDAPYALDALLDPQTSVRPREIMTDTAGYTDIMFALYRLLGYQYSPRLADAGAATLWRLNATDYGPLNQLARHQINTRLIREHYDDVLRIAGSLLQRHTTSSQLVRALRSQTRHLATLARALQHIGRAPKTIHLLDYCNDEHFRRRILVQLNRGEGRHGLSRDVCHGRRGELRQPYHQGQEEQLGALGLIVNTIILYNTIYTQRALDHIASTTGSEPRDEDIERLSPLGSDHTTLTGRYRVLLPAPLHDRSAYRALNTPQDAAAA
jgi:TnpA family transposase